MKGEAMKRKVSGYIIIKKTSFGYVPYFRGTRSIVDVYGVPYEPFKSRKEAIEKLSKSHPAI